jgi:hypothetical protein
MKINTHITCIALFTACMFTTPIFAQSSAPTSAIYDGIAVVGYVDKGAFLNFMGPHLKINLKQSNIMLGMLPTLRIKEDKGPTKNSLVTPALGIGLVYKYNSLVVQLPIFYNSKTSTQNGRWNLGLGIGVNLAYFNRPKPTQ